MTAKLDNPKTVPKTYWSILNKFLSNKKTSVMLPVLVNGELVSYFEQKANLLLNVLLLKVVANYRTLVVKLKKY